MHKTDENFWQQVHNLRDTTIHMEITRKSQEDKRIAYSDLTHCTGRRFR